MGYVDLANMHEDPNTKVPYMMDKGERVYFRSTDYMFANSKCLFIEYTDIIKSPWYMLLMTMIQAPDQFSKYFDTSRIAGLTPEGLTEWYVHRKNQNPFRDLLKEEYEEELTDSLLEQLMVNTLNRNPDLVTLSPQLNIANMLTRIAFGKEAFVKKVVIWYPYECSIIEEDIYNSISDDITVVNGNLATVLKDIPNDSTYVFSDVTNISVLYEMNKLTYSSVVVPVEYWYNFTDDDDLKIDIEAYLDAVDFRYSEFYASVVQE